MDNSTIADEVASNFVSANESSHNETFTRAADEDDAFDAELRSYFEPFGSRVDNAFQQCKDGEMTLDELQAIVKLDMEHMRDKNNSIFMCEIYKEVAHAAEEHMKTCNGNENHVQDDSAVQSLQQELKQIHEQYSTIYDLFTKKNKEHENLRQKYQTVVDKHQKALEEMDNLENQFNRLRENAKDRLTQASIEYDTLVAQHEEDTRTIRTKLNLSTRLIETKDEDIEALKRRNEELRKICSDFMASCVVSDDLEE